MEQISVLARDIVETIEREDAFEEMKKHGGFKKYFKVKNIKEALYENWSNE